MNRPGVTCVIPTHLRHDFLGAAIDSALSQTLSPVEVIVVSDVEDPIAEAICQGRNTEPIPVRYFARQEGPRGASGSRNFGAARSTTDLLAFLDDDDIWLPDFIESCAARLSEEKTDLAVSWIVEFSERHEKPGHSIQPGLRPEDVLAVNPGMTGSNFVIRQEVFNRLSGFDENLPVRNDTDFFARFLRTGFAYSVVPRRLLRQRKHRSGQLTAVNEARARGTELYIEKHRSHLSRRDLRILVQLVHRIRSRCAKSVLARIYHLGWVAVLYGPAGLIRKLRRGRERAEYVVEGFRSDA